MHRSICTYLWLFVLASGLTAQNALAATAEQPGLVWDALTKEVTPKPGEEDVPVTFAVTNRSNARITIERVETSCGCTVAEIPSEPWPLDPGQGGLMKVEFDARNKSGDLTKTILVYTSAGPKTLMLKIHLPNTPPALSSANTERVTNLMEASKNRQSVFQGKCVACHVTPTVGKTGKELYAAACAICHEAAHRASMVPDLKNIKFGTPVAYWEHWTRNGKPSSLMPAFEQKQGGPLTEDQIKSLVEFISTSKGFPSNVTVPSPANAAKP